MTTLAASYLYKMIINASEPQSLILISDCIWISKHSITCCDNGCYDDACIHTCHRYYLCYLVRLCIVKCFASRAIETGYGFFTRVRARATHSPRNAPFYSYMAFTREEESHSLYYKKLHIYKRCVLIDNIYIMNENLCFI